MRNFKPIEKTQSKVDIHWARKIDRALESEENFIDFCEIIDKAPLPAIKFLFTFPNFAVRYGNFVLENEYVPSPTIELLAEHLSTVEPFPHQEWIIEGLCRDIIEHPNASRRAIMLLVNHFTLSYDMLYTVVHSGLLNKEDTLKVIMLDDELLCYKIFEDALELELITPYEAYEICLRDDLEWQDERRSVLLSNNLWYRSLIDSLVNKGFLEKSMETMPYTWFAKVFKWNLVDI